MITQKYLYIIFNFLILNPFLFAQIHPYDDNSYYWQYGNEPILLIGGTNSDNMFNHSDLTIITDELDLLTSVGGNYIRNVMSSRHEGALFPFNRDAETGLYDLTDWNKEYWQRFNNMLNWTFERNIIVQIEVWATRDMYETRDENGGWARHPFNPDNNTNYTREESGLPGRDTYDAHPTNFGMPTEHKFFNTVPELENNEVVLPYQEAYVKKLLSYSLKYDNVLYVMNNETWAAPEWGKYWIRFIQNKANELNLVVYASDMFEQQNITGLQHNPAYENYQTYDFIEISQNNHITREIHWERFQLRRNEILNNPRPFTNTKIYGGTRERISRGGIIVRFKREVKIFIAKLRGRYTGTGYAGGPDEGVNKFFRNIIGGSSSQRFHRPDVGIGLSQKAQKAIKSAAMLMEHSNIFNCTPDSYHEMLEDRNIDEAYLTYDRDNQYILFFPDGGSVYLNLKNSNSEFRLNWLDIRNANWESPTRVKGGELIPLSPPNKGPWIALLQKTDYN